jgi:hypothetical protein
LYNETLHKYKFGQAHYVDLLQRIPMKFSLQFLDIPSSFYKFWKFELFLFLTNSEKIKNARTVSGLKPVHGYSPHDVVGQQADWASAWWPGPAEEVTCGAAAGCARQACSRAVAARATTWWRAGRWLDGGWWC